MYAFTQVEVYLVPGSPAARAAASALAALDAVTHQQQQEWSAGGSPLRSPWSGSLIQQGAGSSQGGAGAGATGSLNTYGAPNYSWAGGAGAAHSLRPRTTRSGSHAGGPGRPGTAGGVQGGLGGGGGGGAKTVTSVSRKPDLAPRGAGGQVLEVFTFNAYALTAEAGMSWAPSSSCWCGSSKLRQQLHSRAYVELSRGKT